MAETIVHDHTATDSGSGAGIILAVVILLVLAFLVIFGIPYLRGMGATSAPQVNVPGQVDVNVHGVQGGGK
jgi:hypothetical protein